MRKPPKIFSDGSLLEEQASAVQPAGKESDPSARHDESQGNHPSDLFNYAPVSLWQEDFSEIKRRLDYLRRNGVQDLRRHFRLHPDEVLSLARMVKVYRVNVETLHLFDARGPEDFREGLSLIFSKETYDVFKEELITFWKGRTFFSRESTNLTLSGDSRDIVIQVTIPPGFETDWSKVYVAITDVTSIKEGIKDLRASEEKYRKVFAVSHTPMMLVDYETGVIVEANEGAGRLLGMVNSEIAGNHFAELFSLEERERALANLLVHGKECGLSASDLHVRHKSGRVIQVSLACTSLEVRDTRLVCVSLKEEDKGKTDPSAVTTERSLQSEMLLKRITGREREVLQLIAAGHTNHSISQQLHISQKTVETHRSRIMQKVDIHRLADLVRFALAAGLSP